MNEIFLILGVALVACGFGAMFGIGGGVIIVPIFVNFLGVDVEKARSAALVAVCITSLGANLVNFRSDLVEFEKIGFLQFPTVIGALIGAWIGKLLDPNMMRFLFGVFLLYVAWQLTAKPKELPVGKVFHEKWVYAVGALICGGFLSALLGIGGGLIFVPVIALLLGRDIRIATATSAFLIGLTATTGASYYIAVGQMDANLAVWTSLGAVIGAIIGARTAQLIKGNILKYTFALILVANSALLISKALNRGGA